MSPDSVNFFDERQPPSDRRRKKKAASKPVFKPYNQHQIVLLPQSLDEMIPAHHLVRVVSATIDKMDVTPLLATYKGGGTSAYHPVMLLKVLVYAYLMKIYTSRPIAKAVREDIHFMWLAGMQRPTFQVFNLFRASRLKGTIDAIFTALVTFLHQEGLINLETYFVDGTIMEANANKHQVVWAKNTRRYKHRLLEKVQALLARIDTLVEQENLQYGDRDLEELGNESTITAEKLQAHVTELNQLLKEQTASRSLTSAVRTLEEKHGPKLAHYEEQERTLRPRNSFVRTDPDATMLRTKSQQLLPAYMVLAGTQNQFLLHYSIHQRASESDALLPHLRDFRARHGRWPDALVGDAAFGSEENYDVLAQEQVTAYLKYSSYDAERQHTRRPRYDRQAFTYDAERDHYRCPQGRSLPFLRLRDDLTRTGYRTCSRVYQCESCQECPLATACLGGRGARTLTVNPHLDILRAQARDRLLSDEGRVLYRRRGTEPETVFGDIKYNQRFRRFHLRGKEKVKVEVGLLGLAHNMKKLFTKPS